MSGKERYAHLDRDEKDVVHGKRRRRDCKPRAEPLPRVRAANQRAGRVAAHEGCLHTSCCPSLAPMACAGRARCAPRSARLFRHTRFVRPLTPLLRP